MTPITPLNFGRKVRSRADFRAAMMLVQTACSDIVEEDSYSSSAASGLQLKKLSPEDINQLAIDPEVSKVAFFRHKSYNHYPDSKFLYSFLEKLYNITGKKGLCKIFEYHT